MQSKSFLSKKFCFNQNFETRSRLGRPFNMCIIINIHAEILFHSRVTHICWMENNPVGHLLKVLVFLFLLYLEESDQVNVLWKMSKRNKKDYKPIFLLSLLILLELYQRLQTFFVIFSSYRFQMKHIGTLAIRCVTTLLKQAIPLSGPKSAQKWI